MKRHHDSTDTDLQLPGEGTSGTFRELVHREAVREGRHFPWRETDDPYRILVSEVMLQQTQADRVREPFSRFLERFPTISSLAEADLAQVLSAWQGLGYNRRAHSLWRSAQEVVRRCQGRVPDDPEQLRSLPGIGPYTAGAIVVFAFNRPIVFIETNIRSVFIHHFFGDRCGIHDRERLPLVAATLDRDEPRRWYNDLMDYGVRLKRLHGNPSRKSRHHSRQSAFEGSNRQQRSALLRLLLACPVSDTATLAAALGADAEQVVANLRAMEREGLLAETGSGWRIAGKDVTEA
jgi:A/G-specific adenine glycosylase